VAWVTDQILQKVVIQGTGAAANFGRPAIGKTGTSQNYHDAWFVGAVPQLAAAVWVGFPQGAIPMVAPRTRLDHVLGGTWPAQIWSLFMSKATKGMKVRTFPQPTSQYVTVLIDTSRNCLPNQFTPPYLIQPVTYLEGTQPTTRCTEPTSYQMLSVPSVVGMTQDEATTLLQNTGFHVSPIARYSNQPVGTVTQQSPTGAAQALQSSTVTIWVSAGPHPTPSTCPTATPSSSPSPSGTASPTPSGSPSPSATPCVAASPSPGTSGSPPAGLTPSPAEVSVPDVTGVTQDSAIHKLQRAGFGVAVHQSPECTGKGCHPRPGIVWKEHPAAGTKLLEGSTVTIWVNP
jgi:membrane peptidoglycan carboxypeptidase